MACRAPDRATERTLRMWVAIVDTLTDPAHEHAVARGSFHAVKLRRAIARDLDRVHVFVTREEQERCAAWTREAITAARAKGPLGVSAILWAAVSALTDAGVAPWSRLARAVEMVAQVTEPEGAAIDAPRAADELLRHMEGVTARLWPSQARPERAGGMR